MAPSEGAPGGVEVCLCTRALRPVGPAPQGSNSPKSTVRRPGTYQAVTVRLDRSGSEGWGWLDTL